MKRQVLWTVAMAATLFANTCIAASASNAGKKEVKTIETPASDSRIEYTGRVLADGNDVSYDWSGVYARIRFKGSSLAVRCSDTGNSWFNVWIDKEMDPVMDSKFMVAAKDTVIYLASGLGKGEHTVILQKRTEGEQGRITLHSFISQDEILQADGRKGRHIEFVGDSYTCGYGTESASKDDPFEARTENCALTYAAITARYFDADYNLVSHSGQGIARNYDDFRPGYNMPDRYSQTFDMDENTVWDASKAAYRPDAVVIYLCTNDFSTGRQPHQTAFCNRYVELLNKIRNNYPEDVPIVCMASNVTPFSFDYIRMACVMSGLKNVYYMCVTTGVHNEDTDLGASWHPNYTGQKKVASCLIPYISTVCNWPLIEKPYR